ncbi:hypothetical protein [Aquiflexum sp.]|uniref:hypothetical protein n=1 Tax=Aquiflexum sp. TaxID=1872584 RepID=UPI0035939542
MKSKKKTFDAVKFMREQRNRISKDIMDLSPEEIVAYFEGKTTSDKMNKNE